MVIAIIALFGSLGGTGYAATQLSASPTAVAGKSKKTKKPVKVLRGKTGPTGPTGSTGPTGATGAQGKEGTAGKEGKEGPAGPFPATLPTGKTITGAYGLAGGSGSDFASDHISWPYPLASVPAVHVIASSEVPPAGCSGSISAPAASSGNLCIFVGKSSTSSTPGACSLVENKCTDGGGGIGNDESLKLGVFIRAFSTASARWYSAGSWAVTG
jgi:hypothetical protein